MTQYRIPVIFTVATFAALLGLLRRARRNRE